MVLSSYERKDSPFVWIQYGLSAETKQIIKTSIRKSDREKKRKINSELRRLETLLVLQTSREESASSENWRWVKPYLSTRYAGRASSLRIYSAHWRWLREFLQEQDIAAPALLTREAVFAYPAWRCAQVKEKSKRSPKMNTALGELKLLGLLMDEAMARHLSTENPARKLKIEREETIPKPEILDKEIAAIRRELPLEKEHRMWMERSFELALHTGLRFMTTRLHRNQVRWASDDIVIERPKGGRRREFTIPIYEAVRPLLKTFCESGEPYLWTMPPGTLVGLVWRKFFVRIGLPHLSFHSTRVTFITRGMRAGIPEAVMMKMVNHASKEISRIYQRWTADDVRRYAGQVPNL